MMAPAKTDIPPLPRRASSRRVNSLVRSFQVETKGEYSPERLAALYDYSARTSWWRVIVVTMLTPVPCLAAILLPEIVRLNPPSDGIDKNGLFFARMFGSYIVFGALVTQQVCSRLPMLPMPRRRFTCIVLIVTICIEAVTYGATVLVGFPLPFTIQLGCIPHQTFLTIALSLSWYKHIRNQPGTISYIVDAVLIFSCQAFLVAVYPVFYWALRNIPTGLPQTLFSILLPILKILSRNLIASVCRDNDERTPQTVVFNADIGNALFISYCMQLNPSVSTMLCLMIVNLAQAALSMREVNRILSSLCRISGEMSALQRQSQQHSDDQPPPLEVKPKVNQGMVERTLDIIQRTKFSRRSVSTSRKLSSAVRRFTGMLVNTARRRRAQINPLSPQPIPETSIVPCFSDAPVMGEKRCTLTPIELLESRYLNLVLKLTYMTEYAVAIEYVEVVVPVIYCTIPFGRGFFVLLSSTNL